MVISGIVRNRSGSCISGALVEIWHADDNGRYRHPSADRLSDIDKRFVGYGALRTDSRGRYAFKSAKPAGYDDDDIRRSPHIHFQVTGRNDRLVTQMFFPDEASNVDDRWYRSVRRPHQLVATALPPADDVLHFRWDITLSTG